MRFESKRDTWLTILIVVVSGGLLLAAVTSNDPAAPFFSALPVILLLWIYYGTHYDLGDMSMVIRHGPLRWTIHYEDITDLKLVRNIWSSAALSAERVHVICRRGSLYISPLDRQAFIAEVNKRRGR